MRIHVAAVSLAGAVGALSLAGAFGASGARAQTADDLRELIAEDLTALGVNLPVWMSQHFPAVMAPVGLGAGSGIGDDAGGFSFGLLTRLGLFNNFDDVGYGLELVDLQPQMPSLMPWPQFGVVAGLNLGDGFELGVDVQFVPDTDVAADDLRLKASMISVGAAVRWRINKAEGAAPAFILGLGGAYYNGSFEVGAGFKKNYDEQIEGHRVTGRVSIQTAPGVEWSLFQLTPELRLAWDIGGLFRPFIGFGLGITFGRLGDELTVKAQGTIDSIDGEPASETISYEERIVAFETEPAMWTIRPHVGFDIVLPPFAFTAQLDLAVMSKDEIDGNLAEGAQSFDTSDPDFLFNKNARGSQSQAALIATFVLRLQF